MRHNTKRMGQNSTTQISHIQQLVNSVKFMWFFEADTCFVGQGWAFVHLRSQSEYTFVPISRVRRSSTFFSSHFLLDCPRNFEGGIADITTIHVRLEILLGEQGRNPGVCYLGNVRLTRSDSALKQDSTLQPPTQTWCLLRSEYR